MTVWKEALWGQCGAAIDTLEKAIVACPDPLWGDRSRNPQYWYLVYHTLFFIDFYLSDSPEGFAPPAPFTLGELDPSGILPDRVYAKDELLRYLEHGRKKCQRVIEGLTEEKAHRLHAFGSIEGTLLESLLYTMRHVQHHAAQLNLILRQEIDSAPSWVSRAKSRLSPDR
jgi:hypothetical protein